MAGRCSRDPRRSPGCPYPSGEMVIESTPNGAYGCFYEEWQQASEKGVVKHFYPWWLEGEYVSGAVMDLRDDERALVSQQALNPTQVGFRRGLEASYRGLRTQEFAEDAELCFRPRENAASTRRRWSGASPRRRSQ